MPVLSRRGHSDQFCGMSQLNGISSFCGERNLGGYRSLRYLPIDSLGPGDYEEIILNGNFQKAINADWLLLPFLPTGQDGWQQGHAKSALGDEYRQTVQGITPQLRPEVEAELQEMDRRLFLVRIDDRNGQPWLIGRATEPLEFFASSQSGGRSSGLNSYRFRFQGVTTKRAWGYNPVF